MDSSISTSGTEDMQMRPSKLYYLVRRRQRKLQKTQEDLRRIVLYRGLEFEVRKHLKEVQKARIEERKRRLEESKMEPKKMKKIENFGDPFGMDAFFSSLATKKC